MAIGLDICNLYPHTSKLADQLCVIRSMARREQQPRPALFQCKPGPRSAAGRASVRGRLRPGTENKNLPAFVVMLDHQGAPVNGALNWTSGFMPSAYQG